MKKNIKITKKRFLIFKIAISNLKNNLLFIILINFYLK